MIVEQTDLWNNTTRDAVYHVALLELAGGFAVAIAFGARGASLNPKIKVDGLRKIAAEAEYNKAIKAKTKGDYRHSPGVSGPNVFSIYGASVAPTAAPAPVAKSAAPAAPPAKWGGVGPMLLNSIDEEEVEFYLTSDEWGAQEKMDGERRMAAVLSDTYGTATAGINKLKGYTHLPKKVEVAVLSHGITMHLDGEVIGENLYCFDLLEKGGTALTDKTCMTRYNQLARLLDGKTGNGLELVMMAITTEEKRALYARIKSEGGEGLVFKRLRSSYVADRPNSGGDALKFKFKASASCIVIGGRSGKRSVEVGLIKDGDTVSVGNVTIPANHDVPAEGDIVEIQYLYVKFLGGNLFQPVYLGKRADIRRSECVIEQLKYKGVGEDDDLAEAA